MLTAADVMTTDVVTVVSETSVRDIARLLHTKRISGVPVVSPDNRVIGIVSEGDLIGHAQIVGEPRRSWWLRLFDDENTLAREYAKTHARVAQDVMTSTVITVTPTCGLRLRIRPVPNLSRITSGNIGCLWLLNDLSASVAVLEGKTDTAKLVAGHCVRAPSALMKA